MADLIQDDVVSLAILEMETQNIDVFNENSRGGMLLETNISDGWNKLTKFFEGAKGGVRRDVSETFSPSELGRLSIISPKLNRQSSYTKTLSSIKKMDGVSNAQYSDVIGEAHATDEQTDYVNLGIGVAANVIKSNTDLTSDVSAVGDGTMTYPVLVGGCRLFGDKAPMLETVVIHSKPYYDMVGDAAAGITVPIQELGLSVVYGIPSFPAKVFVVTDAEDLVFDNAGTDNYITLVLSGGGVVVTRSEESNLQVDNNIRVGNEVAPTSIYDYTPQITIRGWSFTGGIDNPTLGQVKAAGNWSLVTEAKNSAGVAIITK